MKLPFSTDDGMGTRATLGLGPNQHQVTIAAIDGRGGVAEQKFTICVQPDPDNHAPDIVTTPVTEFAPGENEDDRIYRTDVDAVDPDQDDVEYSLVVFPPGMQIDRATGLLQWDIPANTSNTN